MNPPSGNVLNFIGSQVLWLAAVGGAANAMPWLGPLAFLAFAVWQLTPRYRARGDWSLMWLALPVGFLVDSVMAGGGLLRYASPLPSADYAPVWILTLWMGFALTFNHSLAYVARRPWLAVVMGAVVGPFSYWVAARTWGAVEFTESLPKVLIWLGTLWGVAMGLMAWLAIRLGRIPLKQRTQTGP